MVDEPDRRGEIANSIEEVVRVLNTVAPAPATVKAALDLLAELAQFDNIEGVKQANNDNLAPVDGLSIYAGNDEILAAVLDMGEPGGILTASHIVGAEMRRMVDEPAERAAIHNSLLPVFEALSVAPAAVSNKAALNLLGHPVGAPRLPYVEADEHETATIRAMLTERGLLVGATA